MDDKAEVQNRAGARSEGVEYSESFDVELSNN